MILTLCGSARFEAYFRLWNEALGLAGHPTFGLCAWPSHKPEREWYTPAQKTMLDGVHFAKIAASDAILVLNPFAYVGESTLREIAEARRLGKRVFTLESWGVGCGITNHHYQSVRDAALRFGVPQGFVSPFRAVHEPGCCSFPMDLFGPGGPDRSALVDMIQTRTAAITGVPRDGEERCASESRPKRRTNLCGTCDKVPVNAVVIDGQSYCPGLCAHPDSPC